MSKSIYDKALQETIQETIQELLGEPGKETPFMKQLFENYSQSILKKGKLYIEGGGNIEDIREELINEYKEGVDRLVNAFTGSYEFKDSLYKKNYDRLKALGDEGETWEGLFSGLYDEDYLSEIFVRLVEEQEGVKITSAKQLQELTGITEIYGYWDEEKGKQVPYGDKKPTKKEAQEEANEQIGDAFIGAMSYRYSKALEGTLRAGGKYKDLLQIKPKEFNLPKTWSGSFTKDQYTTIVSVICLEFLLNEPGGAMIHPSPRYIADELEAPYSVIMDAYKLFK